MELTKKERNGIITIKLDGSADATPIIQALDGELRGAISLDSLKVFLDVSDLSGIDSATLEAFLSFQKKFGQVNATLFFVNMTDYLKKVFEVVRLQEKFVVFDDVESAVAASRKRKR